MVYVISKKREYTKPKYCPTEGRYFNSNQEVEDYMKENDLRLGTRPRNPYKRKPGSRKFVYDKKLKKVVEVT